MHENHLVDNRHCGCACLRVELFVTLWTVADKALLSTEILQARILELVAMPSSRGSSRPGDGTRISCIASRFFSHGATREAQALSVSFSLKANKLMVTKQEPITFISWVHWFFSPLYPSLPSPGQLSFSEMWGTICLGTEHSSSTLQTPAFRFFPFLSTSPTNLCRSHLFFLEQKWQPM